MMTNFNYITTTPVESMTDEELDAAATTIERIRGLFSGLPKGVKLWDAVLCKYARRDPAAIAFMQSYGVTA